MQQLKPGLPATGAHTLDHWQHSHTVVSSCQLFYILWKTTDTFIPLSHSPSPSISLFHLREATFFCPSLVIFFSPCHRDVRERRRRWIPRSMLGLRQNSGDVSVLIFPSFGSRFFPPLIKLQLGQQNAEGLVRPKVWPKFCSTTTTTAFFFN